MDEPWKSSFEYAFGRAAGHALGGIVVWGTLLVFVLTFAAVFYVLARRMGVGIHVDLRGESPGGEERRRNASSASNAGMSASSSVGFGRSRSGELPRLEDLAKHRQKASRDEFLRSLDTAQDALAKVMLVLLVAALVGITFLYAMLLLRYPDDGNRDFMVFYGSVVYGLGFLTLTAKILWTWGRLTPRTGDGPGLFDQLRSKIDVNVRSEPQTFSLGTEAIERARRHVAAGGTLDEACRLADPRYESLGPWAKTAFRKALEMALRAAS
jgi:hypothetical protein